MAAAHGVRAAFSASEEKSFSVVLLTAAKSARIRGIIAVDVLLFDLVK